MAPSKLTDAQVDQIRKLWAAKGTRYDWTVARLASQYKTSRAKVWSIVKDVPRGTVFNGFPGTDLTSTNIHIDE